MVQEEKKNKFFDTLLKFKESEINGELVGFVYANKDGKLFGTREDDPEHKDKKICVLSENIDKSYIEPNLLYKVSLSNMPNYKGYIVESAHLVKYKARVCVSKDICKAILSFGNHKIYYDPFNGKSDKSNTQGGALSVVKGIKNISNKKEAISSFKKAIKSVDAHIKKIPKVKVETLISPKCFYQTIITFGNKKIIYNPFDGYPHESDLNMVLKRINKNVKSVDKQKIKDDVLRSVRNVNRHMEADGFILPKQVV